MINFPKGQAALLSVMLVFVLGFLTVDGVSNLTIGNRRTVNDMVASAQAYYAAEGIIEDAAVRYVNSDLSDPTSNTPDTITLGGATITRSIAGDGPYTVTVKAVAGGRTRILETEIVQVVDTVNFDNGLQAGPGGISINNSATVNGDVCSEGDLVGAGNLVTGNVTLVNGLSTIPPTATHGTYSNNWVSFNHTSSYRDAGHQFAVSQNAYLARLRVYLKRNNNPGNLDLKIVPNKITAGVDSPDNRATPLTTQVIPQSAVSSVGSFVTITLDDPVYLPAGTYWIVLDGPATASATNYWAWLRDDDGKSASDVSLLMSNWSHNSSPQPNYAVVAGDFVSEVYLSTDQSEGIKIENMNVTGVVEANLSINVFAGDTDGDGDADLACPNVADDTYCKDATATQCPGDTLEIGDPQIENWKLQASGGIECELCDENGDIRLSSGGPYSINGDTVIQGDLVLNGTVELNVNGVLWVQGNLNLENNARIIIAEDMRDKGYGVIIVGNGGTDGGNVTVSNNGYIDGGSVANMMIFSQLDNTAINGIVVQNSAAGDVFFVAPRTCIRSSNSSASKALIGYCLQIQNSAEINYDSLLGEFFAQTPFTNEVWTIGKWREVSTLP